MCDGHHAPTAVPFNVVAADLDAESTAVLVRALPPSAEAGSATINAGARAAHRPSAVLRSRGPGVDGSDDVRRRRLGRSGVADAGSGAIDAGARVARCPSAVLRSRRPGVDGSDNVRRRRLGRRGGAGSVREGRGASAREDSACCDADASDVTLLILVDLSVIVPPDAGPSLRQLLCMETGFEGSSQEQWTAVRC